MTEKRLISYRKQLEEPMVIENHADKVSTDITKDGAVLDMTAGDTVKMLST